MHLSVDTLKTHKLHLQITIFTLALLGFILSIARLAIPGTIVSRMSVWIVVVCLKSTLIITYEVLTARSLRFERWSSKKANMILNCIEPIFWLTAFILTTMGISARCVGASCGVGVVVMFLTLGLVLLTVGLAIVSVRERGEEKRGRGSGRGRVSRTNTGTGMRMNKEGV